MDSTHYDAWASVPWCLRFDKKCRLDRVNG